MKANVKVKLLKKEKGYVISISFSIQTKEHIKEVIQKAKAPRNLFCSQNPFSK